MSQTAKYGVATPGVTLAGGYGEHSGWEQDITVEDFAAIARAFGGEGITRLPERANQRES